MRAREPRRAPPIRLEVATSSVGLAAAAGLGRLTMSSASWRVLAPSLLCSGVGFAVTAAGRRRVGSLVSALVGVIAVGLVGVWWFEPRLTIWGLPTPASLHALAHLIDRGNNLIGSRATPLPATAGIVLWVAVGGGLVAVVSGALLGRFGVGPALLPPFALFSYTALLSSGTGRVWGTLLMIGALAVVAATADFARGGHDRPARRRSRPQRALGAGPVLAMVTVAMVVAMAVSPALARTHLDAFPFPSPQGGPLAGVGARGDVVVAGGGSLGAVSGAGQPLVATSDLVDDLGAVITGRSEQLLFVADTPVPTYWQLGVLTRFDGQRWTADPLIASLVRSPEPAGEVAGERGTGPPVLPTPVSGPVFSAFVSVAALRTTLLPAPPAILSVAGPASLRDGVGVLADRPSGPDMSYSTVAEIPAPSSSSASSAAAPAATSAVPAAALAPYLALPRVDPAVVSLAHSVVRGDTTTLSKALSLASLFRSARFRYTLDSTAVAGTDSLTTFLFHRRAGFCQQFAGAYAVLARLDGLPTRVAVGFTPGQREPDGSYLVTGVDAHVWPEVYMGPAQGWVSVEPTPPGGDGQPAQGVLLAPESAHVGGQLSRENARRGPNSQPKPLPSIPNVPPPGARQASHAGHHPAPGGGPSVVLWSSLAAIAAAAAAVAWRHRIGDVLERIRRRPPRAAVLRSWRRVDRELGRRHPGRLPAETLSEFLERLKGGGGSRRRVPVPVALTRLAHEPALGELADLASRACYGAADPSPGDVVRARRLQAQLCAAARGRRRLRARAASRAPGR